MEQKDLDQFYDDLYEDRYTRKLKFEDYETSTICEDEIKPCLKTLSQTKEKLKERLKYLEQIDSYFEDILREKVNEMDILESKPEDELDLEFYDYTPTEDEVERFLANCYPQDLKDLGYASINVVRGRSNPNNKSIDEMISEILDSEKGIELVVKFLKEEIEEETQKKIEAAYEDHTKTHNESKALEEQMDNIEEMIDCINKFLEIEDYLN